VEQHDRASAAGFEIPDGPLREVRDPGQHLPSVEDAGRLFLIFQRRLAEYVCMLRRAALCIVLCLATVAACTLKDEWAVPDDVAAPPADAQRTASGIASKVLRVGLGGVRPTARSTVTVQYAGWTTDGTMFDGPAMHGGPQTFPLDGVIKGWTEGLQLMVRGEKRRFWIPGDLAYDNIDRPGAPKGMLVFDIELLEVR
jgi:hypothetical protein